MSHNTIKQVDLEGIHGRYSLNISFNSTLNILYGENGTGKSTLIHIIANVANQDFMRFAFLEFKTIKVTYSNGEYIFIEQDHIIDKPDNDRIITVSNKNGEKLKFSKKEAFDTAREIESERYDSELGPELLQRTSNFVEKYSVPIIKTSYFPAFRTMLEAWSSQTLSISDSYFGKAIKRNRSASLLSERVTSFSRNLFGQFLPTINYPSPIDIEQRLSDEIRHCHMKVASYESSIFTESFVKVFSALLEGGNSKFNNINADKLIDEISELTNESSKNKFNGFQEDSNTYKRLKILVGNNNKSRNSQNSASGALEIYRDALVERKRIQEITFESINTYFEVVNSFLKNKKLDYKVGDGRKIPHVGLKFPDNTWSSIKVMSSGERQLLTMLYAVNRMSENSVVLIDEPEISLHIDWQEELLGKMMEHLGERQIIVCTHSPIIASDFTDYMTEVNPIFNDNSFGNPNIFNDSEDDGDY